MFPRALQLAEADKGFNEMSIHDIPDSEPGPMSTAQARVPFIPEDPDAPKECQICCETKHINLFPHTTDTSDCRCLSDTCLICLQEHMKTQMHSKEWKEGSVTCPVCNRSLTHQEIEDYADGETLTT